MTARINIPNQITIGRLGLAGAFVVLLTFFDINAEQPRLWALQTGFWVFLVAVISDVVDGYLARRWGQETVFGRIADPFCDKVLICGAFVLLAGPGFYDAQLERNITGVAPWMAVVILARELLVSALRAQAESGGANFAASWSGKAKMFAQSFAVAAVLGVLSFEALRPLNWLATSAVWAATIITAISMIGYVQRAREILSRRATATPTPTSEPERKP